MTLDPTNEELQLRHELRRRAASIATAQDLNRSDSVPTRPELEMAGARRAMDALLEFYPSLAGMIDASEEVASTHAAFNAVSRPEDSDLKRRLRRQLEDAQTRFHETRKAFAKQNNAHPDYALDLAADLMRRGAGIPDGQ